MELTELSARSYVLHIFYIPQGPFSQAKHSRCLVQCTSIGTLRAIHSFSGQGFIVPNQVLKWQQCKD